MMAVGSRAAFIAIAATAAGCAVTVLLAAWLGMPDDQDLLAAEQQFSNLSHSEAQRILATFDRLNEPSKLEERNRIESIHDAVTHDQSLNDKLKQLYTWWQTRDDAQRLELRDLPSEEWSGEVQRQISESEAEDVALQIPWPFGRGPIIRVSRQQVDRFLEDALPTESLTGEDRTLIESVNPEDRSLARVVVIAGTLPRRRTDSSGNIPDVAEQILNAAREHLLPEDRQFLPEPVAGSRREPRGRGPRGRDMRRETMMSFAILKSVTDHLSAEFLRRQAVSDEAIEKEFASLDAPERISQMMSDPATAVRSLQARLRSADGETPTGRLATHLAEFNTIVDRFRQRIQQDAGTDRRGPRDGGRQMSGRRDRRPETGNDRARRPRPPLDRQQQ